MGALIATAKRPETRASRIAKIVADAAEGKRP
ncbi:YdeI/OmpD-associated family protein [Microbacterium sp. A93]